ncbi:hypothetical protein CFN78_21880 [Amycolatopsis antarctica]|uniref:Uncharacterized protein n=1 Tax=Amycolatopsis antarctica TaxID=1854586 RepID=A0A263D0R1_9PSEU|nr:hypothetical protein [Amycolatopsis antarctica]OZM71116.1 hypothetical protein CFN78_21880 [Amycolatopsis antarctica]
MTITSDALAHSRGSVPLPVTIAAWAVPIMVLGQFAMLAIIPVAIALAGAVLRTRDRLVRAAAVLLAVTYAIPLLAWLTRADGAPSLSKDIHPAFVVLITGVSAVLLLAVHRRDRQR